MFAWSLCGTKSLSFLTPNTRRLPSQSTTLPKAHLKFPATSVRYSSGLLAGSDGRLPAEPPAHPSGTKTKRSRSPDAHLTAETVLAKPTKRTLDLRSYYEKDVAKGFQVTYDEWNIHRIRRTALATHVKKSECDYLSTLVLDKGLQRGQFIHLPRSHQTRLGYFGAVLHEGRNIGSVRIYQHKNLDESLVCPYYDSDAGYLRFRRKDGSDLPWAVDLVGAAWQSGIRPLVRLAFEEGLLPGLPDGLLRSFDLQESLKRPFYLRSQRLSPSKKDFLGFSVHVPDASSFPLGMYAHPDSVREREHLRIIPYIDQKEELRMWDYDYGIDILYRLQWSQGPFLRNWDTGTVEKRAKPLFDYAKTLGYWKDVILDS